MDENLHNFLVILQTPVKQQNAESLAIVQILVMPKVEDIEST